MFALPKSFCCLCCKETDLGKASKHIGIYHAVAAFEYFMDNFELENIFAFLVTMAFAGLLYWSSKKKIMKVV